MVQQSIQQADSRCVIGQEASPVLERPVRGDTEGAAFVGGGDKAEEELGAGVIHRGEADLVDQDEVGFQYLLEDPADRVVGQAPIKGLDQLDRVEVADPEPGLDGRVTEGDEQVAFAGAGRADEAEVLLRRTHSRLDR